MINLSNGKPLGVNKIGELCFKGPMVMNGYYKNPEETTATIDDEGWLHTGDVGYFDEYYNFHIVDRLKELIKYKGYQVKINLVTLSYCVYIIFLLPVGGTCRIRITIINTSRN